MLNSFHAVPHVVMVLAFVSLTCYCLLGDKLLNNAAACSREIYHTDHFRVTVASMAIILLQQRRG